MDHVDPPAISNLPLAIELVRSPSLNHHVSQGSAWLVASAEGANTAALAYAAFELRLAIERIGLQYWMDLLGPSIQTSDFKDLRSFKAIENRIYELAGHQQEINGHFRFARVLLQHLKIDSPLPTPRLGELSKRWHECSELCHIAWTLAATHRPMTIEAHQALREIEALVKEHVGGLIWPSITDPELLALRSRFISGNADENDVLNYLKKTGSYAVYKPNDGSPATFVGKAIPPEAK